MLLALRRGGEQGDTELLETLAARFRPRYTDLLLSRKLGACLDKIRNEYRNKVSHTTETFDLSRYERFVRLAVANRRFGIWSALGPERALVDASEGVLHHHLSESRLVPSPTAAVLAGPEEEGLVAQLLALRTSARSRLVMHLRAYHAAAAAGIRSIAVTSTNQELLFRVGTAVRFGFQVNQTCHVT